ncbi:MAG: hypothetical protein ACRDUV_23890 [Pseudonocardiaceae bacterium]
MDEMLADLISESTLEGLEAARRRTGGRKPKLTNRQITITQQMYNEKGTDGRRRDTVAVRSWTREAAPTRTPPPAASTSAGSASSSSGR